MLYVDPFAGSGYDMEADIILVTHEHCDHIMSVGGLSKKYDIPVYSNIETFSAMKTQAEKISNINKKIFEIESEFKIGSLNIKSKIKAIVSINPIFIKTRLAQFVL